MGTRHLIGVVKNGEFKVAQYGQWDGYPSGQGKDVLEFLKTADLNKFSKIIDECSFFSKDDWNKLIELEKEIGSKNVFDQNPQLSRDLGAEILWHVYRSDSGIKLKDSRAFGLDSLFCEFAYVLDLDESNLEVYKGFQTKLPEKNRFTFLRDQLTQEQIDKERLSSDYFEVSLAAVYDFDNLPSVETMEKDVLDRDEE